jgi:hypothetical protein
MWDACRLLWSLLIGLFRSRASLEAENLALRQQIVVLRRTVPKRFCFHTFDRLVSGFNFRQAHALIPGPERRRPNRTCDFLATQEFYYWRICDRPTFATLAKSIPQRIRAQTRAARREGGADRGTKLNQGQACAYLPS